MSDTYSKTVLAYNQVRRSLQSGRYLPGQRIDPATLAAEFEISSTPVRCALYRLVGEGLLEDHARGGMHVPLPTEVALRDLYGWMECLLLMACDMGAASVARKNGRIEVSSSDDDLVKLTWKLFDAIALATGRRCFHHAVKLTNDRLAPIRRVKQGLIENLFGELSELNRHWQKRDIPALKSALREYHERRKQLVPSIVDFMNDRSDYLH